MLGLAAGFVPRFLDSAADARGIPHCRYGVADDNTAAADSCILTIPAAPDAAMLTGATTLDISRAVTRALDNRIYLSLFPASSQGAALDEDIVADTFCFLSLHDQRSTSARDAFGRFTAAASTLGRLGLLHRPVVAEYGSLLRALLRERGAHLASPARYNGREAGYCVTHDVDYITRRRAGFAWHEVRALFGGSGTARERFERFSDYLAVLAGRGDPPAVSLLRMLAGEREKGVRATWFLKSAARDARDVPYKLEAPVLREAMKTIRDDGHAIGLHPSYLSFRESADILRERTLLEGAAGRHVDTVRQHYLRFEYPDTWRAQRAAGVRCDATLGFAEYEGFRNGCCHPFLPYDVERDEPIPLWCLPLPAMDGTFHHYRGLDPAHSTRILDELAATTAAHGGIFSVLFHNIAYDRHNWPGWDVVFEHTLDQAVEKNIFSAPIGEMVDTWLAGLGLDGAEAVQKIVLEG